MSNGGRVEERYGGKETRNWSLVCSINTNIMYT